MPNNLPDGSQLIITGGSQQIDQLQESSPTSLMFERLDGSHPVLQPFVDQCRQISQEIDRQLQLSSTHDDVNRFQILQTYLLEIMRAVEKIKFFVDDLLEPVEVKDEIDNLIYALSMTKKHGFTYLWVKSEKDELARRLVKIQRKASSEQLNILLSINQLLDSMISFLDPMVFAKFRFSEFFDFSFKLSELHSGRALNLVATVYDNLDKIATERVSHDRLRLASTEGQIDEDRVRTFIIDIWSEIILRYSDALPDDIKRLDEKILFDPNFDKKLVGLTYNWLLAYLANARHVLNSIYEKYERSKISPLGERSGVPTIEIYQQIIRTLLLADFIDKPLLTGCGIVDAFTLWQACRVVDDPRLAHELAIRAREAGIFVQRPVDWINGPNDSSDQGDDFFVLAIKEAHGLKREARLSSDSFQELFRKPIDEVTMTNDGRTLVLTFNSQGERFWFEIKHDAKKNEVNFDWSCTLPLNPDTFANYREFFLSCAGIASKQATELKTSHAQKSGRGGIGSSPASQKTLSGPPRTEEEKAEAKARPMVEVAETMMAERRNGPLEMQHILLNHDDIAKICQESGVQESVVTKIIQKIDETFNRKDPVLSEFKKIIAAKGRINLFRLDVGHGYRAVFVQVESGENKTRKWLLVDFERRDVAYRNETIAGLTTKALGLLEKHRKQQAEEKK